MSGYFLETLSKVKKPTKPTATPNDPVALALALLAFRLRYVQGLNVPVVQLVRY